MTSAPANKGVHIVGLKDLAAHLDGIHMNTVYAYSLLAVDPLPLRVNTRTKVLSGWSIILDEWKARRCGGVMPDGSLLRRLEGWDEICAALGGVDRDTALKWAKRQCDRLPVYGIHRNPALSRPWCYLVAVRDWLARGDLPCQESSVRALPGRPARTPRSKGPRLAAPSLPAPPGVER